MNLTHAATRPHSNKRSQPTKERAIRVWRSKRLQGGVAALLTFAGISIFSSPAFAHSNLVSGVVSCASPSGSGYSIAWTVANDYNLAESVQVASATGGVATITPQSFTIAASGNGSGGNGTTPYKNKTLQQILPASASGKVTLSVNARYSDNFTTSNSGSVTLPSSCGATPRPPTATATATATTLPQTSPTPTTSPVIIPTTTPVTTATPTPIPVAAPTPAPQLTIQKTERVGTIGAYVRGPIKAVDGDRLEYQIVVANTGNTALTVHVTDSRCDASTFRPAGNQTLDPGRSLVFNCSHKLGSSTAVTYRNVAIVVGTSPQGTSVGPLKSSVTAQLVLPQLQIKKLVPTKVTPARLKIATFTG